MIDGITTVATVMETLENKYSLSLYFVSSFSTFVQNYC